MFNFAIFESGGKQHRVAEGDILRLEKLDQEIGSTIEFETVFLTSSAEHVDIGAPFLPHARVTAKVVSQGRDDKVHIIKFRRRKHHMKQQGHRQYFTAVKITRIEA